MLKEYRLTEKAKANHYALLDTFRDVDANPPYNVVINRSDERLTIFIPLDASSFSANKFLASYNKHRNGAEGNVIEDYDAKKWVDLGVLELVHPETALAPTKFKAGDVLRHRGTEKVNRIIVAVDTELKDGKQTYSVKALDSNGNDDENYGMVHLTVSYVESQYELFVASPKFKVGDIIVDPNDGYRRQILRVGDSVYVVQPISKSGSANDDAEGDPYSLNATYVESQYKLFVAPSPFKVGVRVTNENCDPNGYAIIAEVDETVNTVRLTFYNTPDYGSGAPVVKGRQYHAFETLTLYTGTLLPADPAYVAPVVEKVFSVHAFLATKPVLSTPSNLSPWVVKAEGKTKAEMRAMDLMTDDKWMVDPKDFVRYTVEKVFSIFALKKASPSYTPEPRGWEAECEGLTKAEITKLGYGTDPSWMVDPKDFVRYTVFSTTAWMKSTGYNAESIFNWVKKSEGKTTDEMKVLGFGTVSNWMVALKDYVPYVATKRVLRLNAMKCLAYELTKNTTLAGFLSGNFIENLKRNDGKTFDELKANGAYYDEAYVKACFDEVTE